MAIGGGDDGVQHPSGASEPSARRTAGVVIRWPTLRTNSSDRPGRVTVEPSGAVNRLVRVEGASQDLPPLSKVSTRSPFIRPSQLRRRRPCRRRRRRRSSPPDRRWWTGPPPAPRRRCPPGRWRRSDGRRSITTSTCRPLWRKTRPPRWPTYCEGFAGRCRRTPPSLPDRPMAPVASGKASSRKALARATTLGAARGVIGPGRRQIAERVRAVERVIQAAPAGVGGVEHEAGVEAGTTSCGPARRGHLGVDLGRSRW
jgi:hypothetical protein